MVLMVDSSEWKGYKQAQRNVLWETANVEKEKPTKCILMVINYPN